MFGVELDSVRVRRPNSETPFQKKKRRKKVFTTWKTVPYKPESAAYYICPLSSDTVLDDGPDVDVMRLGNVKIMFTTTTTTVVSIAQDTYIPASRAGRDEPSQSATRHPARPCPHTTPPPTSRTPTKVNRGGKGHRSSQHKPQP